MNKFLKDLEKELKKLKVSEKDIEEILDDHKEMLEAAKNEGLDELQIEEKFGKPGILAKDLSKDISVQKIQSEKSYEEVESCVKNIPNDFNLVKTFPLIIEEISIGVSLVNEDIDLTSYDGESIQIYAKGIKKIEDYTISLENNELLIKKNKKIGLSFSISRESGKFYVLVPKEIAITVFDCKTVSGDCNINGFTTKTFHGKSTSGDLELTNIMSSNTKFSTVSGDISINKLSSDQFSVSLVSGDLEMEQTVIKGDMTINSVSGDLELLDVECFVAYFKTVSGDLEGKEFYPTEISLKSVSGDINITNRNVLKEIKVISKKTVSGDININQ